MEPTRKKTTADNKNVTDPIKEARLEAEEGIAEDPDFANDPASDDLDEGELANLDNSSDNDM